MSETQMAKTSVAPPPEVGAFTDDVVGRLNHLSDRLSDFTDQIRDFADRAEGERPADIAPEKSTAEVGAPGSIGRISDAVAMAEGRLVVLNHQVDRLRGIL